MIFGRQREQRETPASNASPFAPPPGLAGNMWARVSDGLADVLSAADCQNWVSETAFAGLEGEDVVVWVQDEITKDFFEQEFAFQIAGVIERLNLPIRRAVFRVWSAP
jgi:hypothetical protein